MGIVPTAVLDSTCTSVNFFLEKGQLIPRHAPTRNHDKSTYQDDVSVLQIAKFTCPAASAQARRRSRNCMEPATPIGPSTKLVAACPAKSARPNFNGVQLQSPG
jgi:hypothetical protein